MSKLTEEELKELASLGEEFEREAEANVDASARRHLEAFRLRKKFSTGGKKHGEDFAVAETNIGNFVIRKPTGTEIDTFVDLDNREAGENFVASLMLHPSTAEVQAMFADQPGLVGAIVPIAFELAKVERAAEAKK